MSQENQNRICPVERAGGLDNRFRRIIQNPRKILKPFIKEGMSVLDVGCGPGFFTIEIAAMLKGSGTIIAADIQLGMLDKLTEKIRGTALESKIKVHHIQGERLGLEEKFDFVLAFYMVHEIPDKKLFFQEIRTLLKPGGEILIVEPKFHVNKKAFNRMVEIIEESGLKTDQNTPRIIFSRSLLAEA